MALSCNDERRWLGEEEKRKVPIAETGETFMSIRNFDALFRPKSIALIGASNRPHSVGAVVADNLFTSGFKGPVMPVNPHETAIRSTLNYRSVADLPTAPDLALETSQLPVQGCVDRLLELLKERGVL